MTDAALEALLEVQAHDTRLDQLRHRLEALPERAARDAAVAAVAETEATIAEQRAVQHDLAAQQKRIDDEVESLKGKRSAHDAKLYGGTVTSPRELQDLQDEIDSLSRRISQLEDDEIEVMEQVEPVDAAIAELEGQLAARTEAVGAAEQALIAAEAEIAVEVDDEEGARVAAAEPVPAELLATYEKLRAGRGGIGIARLVGSQCGGCHLGLSAVEVARLKKLPEGELATCEECGRILVP